MRYVPPILALAAIFVLLVLLALWGWRRRGRRQGDLPAPAPLVTEESPEAAGPVPGAYVNTTEAGRPFERIVAHGLGVRSRVSVRRRADGSWDLRRPGAVSFTIPAEAVAEVRTAPGMAGKVIGGDGLLLLRWRLGGRELDTGIRLDRREDHDLLLHAPNALRKETS